MHKGVILLTKAQDKEEAFSNVESFLESYGDGKVWDWYQIGGRWSNILAPKDLRNKWLEKTKDILEKREDGLVFNSDIEKNANTLQSAWEELGLKGKNSYSDHYSLPDTGDEYDIIPLSECIDTVREWVKDLDKEAEEFFSKMIECRENLKDGEWDSSPYYAGLYKDAKYGNFCFESNVYNIDDHEAEEIPENIIGWFAVMVDMHN